MNQYALVSTPFYDCFATALEHHATWRIELFSPKGLQILGFFK